MTSKHNNWGYLFVAPYIIGLLMFFAIPIIFSFYISFTEYNIFNAPKFVGLANYIMALKDPEVWIAFRNVITFAVIVESIQLFLSCILAVALNQKIRGIKLFRVIYFIPVLTPIVAIAMVWSALYNPMYGIPNYLLSFIGIGPFSYTFSSNWFEIVASIAAMTIWKNVGYTTVFLLAGLQSISTDILEAADIDGAGRVRKFFNITIPMLSPTIFFLLIIGTVGALQVFDSFFIMKENTGVKTYVIGTLIYKYAFEYSKVGMAATIGWISFVLIASLTYLQKKTEKRWVHYE